MAKTRQIGRSAETGQFTAVEKAIKYPKTHVVERIKIEPKKK